MGKYQLAQQVLSEHEKNRILSIYLNTTDGVTDWDAAAKDIGIDSAAAMKVSLRNAMEKLDRTAIDNRSESNDPPAEAIPILNARKRKGASLRHREAEPKQRIPAEPASLVRLNGGVKADGAENEEPMLFCEALWRPGIVSQPAS
ncbi:hypothetical protein HII31_10014 [Pseudocercospora fuligena]|uniref:Uncharacterized protein n=1 Tax=Pseudocercospora fuligena TaxID=685502 RepID=A0A8H6RDR2_9PEZI|nr:hypothetical protein HII31_10014 [Pseudocercospora fuligena]